MLKRLPFLVSLATLAFCAHSPSANASDIGGPPVKAISPSATYSTVYSETIYTDPVFYGAPRTVIIVPVASVNSIIIRSGDSRFESITPTLYIDSARISPRFPHHRLTDRQITPNQSMQSTYPHLSNQTSIIQFQSGREPSLSNCQLILKRSSHRVHSSGSGIICR